MSDLNWRLGDKVIVELARLARRELNLDHMLAVDAGYLWNVAGLALGVALHR